MHSSISHRVHGGIAWSRTQAVTRSWNEAGKGGERKKVGKGRRYIDVTSQ